MVTIESFEIKFDTKETHHTLDPNRIWSKDHFKLKLPSNIKHLLYGITELCGKMMVDVASVNWNMPFAFSFCQFTTTWSTANDT